MCVCRQCKGKEWRRLSPAHRLLSLVYNGSLHRCDAKKDDLRSTNSATQMTLGAPSGARPHWEPHVERARLGEHGHNCIQSCANFLHTRSSTTLQPPVARHRRVQGRRPPSWILAHQSSGVARETFTFNILTASFLRCS